MVVSTYSGIRGGSPIAWAKKWLPESEYTAQYGETPQTIWAWAKKHNKSVPYRGELKGERRIQPRKPFKQNADGRFVLNPEWDFTKGYQSRDERTNEWIVCAFSGQVNVKVHGTVQEGDFIVPSGLGDGYGISVPHTLDNLLNAIGIAWESRASPDDGTVLVAVGIK